MESLINELRPEDTLNWGVLEPWNFSKGFTNSQEGNPQASFTIGASPESSALMGDSSGQNSSGSGSRGDGKTHVKGFHQKNYRARQKEQLSSLEQEIREKRAALERLSQENNALTRRSDVLSKVVSCRDEQVALAAALEQQLSGAPSAQYWPAAGLGLFSTPPSPTDIAFYTGLQPETLVPLYKAFLAEVSGLLLHCQHPCSNPADPVVARTTAVVERMRVQLRHVLVLNPKLVHAMLALNMEKMQPGAAPEPHWDGVAAALQLAPEQRADVLAVYDMYVGLVSKVYEERQAMARGMGGGGCGQPSAAAAAAPPPADSPGEELEVAEALAASLGRERSARALLCCFLLGKVLDGAQFAKVAVFSYPFFPDALALATAIRRLGTSGCSGGGGGGGGGGVRRQG